MKDELLTIQQAADLLGVSSKTLRRWEAKGHLTPQRTIGNQRRYSRIELTAMIQKSNGKVKLAAPVTNPQQIIPQSPEPQILPQSAVEENVS